MGRGNRIRELFDEISAGRSSHARWLARRLLSACTPTIRIEVAPINIYAKLDADVRVKLDKEVQTAIQQNPDLF